MSSENNPSPIETKQQIRDFSRSTPEGMKERSRVAGEVLSARKEGRRILSQISQIRTERDTHTANSADAHEKSQVFQNDIVSYREQLARAEATLLNKIYGIFGKETSEVGFNREFLYFSDSAQKRNEAVAANETMLAINNTELIARLELAKARVPISQEILGTFYQEQGSSLETRNEIQRITDVKTISTEKAVTFVHGITYKPYEDGGRTNRILNRDTDWRGRLSIILGLQPDLGTSTIVSGDDTSRMWSKMGVIINSGEVIKASSNDAQTTVTGLREKNSSIYSPTSYYDMSPNDVSRDITQAIDQRMTEHYNEIIVRDPQVAGMYVNLDPDIYRSTYDAAPHQEIIDFASEAGIPIFVIHNGEVYRSAYGTSPDGSMKIVGMGEPLTPAEVLAQKFELSDTAREPIISRARASLTIDV